MSSAKSHRSGRGRTIRALAALCACAGLALALAALASAETPAPGEASAAPSAVAAPSPAATQVRSARTPDASAVIDYLSEVISWYRHLPAEAALVRDPTETLYYSDDRQMAGQILALAFAYARAEADLLAKTAPQPGAPTSPASPQERTPRAGEELADAQARLAALRKKLTRAPKRDRAALESQVAAVQSTVDLAEARADAARSLLQLEGAAPAAESPGGLAGQIDELERSVPEAEQNGKQPAQAPPPALTGVSEPSGIGGIATDLLELRNRISSLDQAIDLTNALAARVSRLNNELISELARIDARAGELAKEGTAGDAAALSARRAELQALVDERKLAAAAMAPLGKQALTFKLYAENLGRWRAALQRNATSDLTRLATRLLVFGTLLGLIFLGSLLWRRITFRYVQDIRHRSQILAARRVVVAILVALVLFINFASELGSFATVMGLAAAGVAVALQNVILSAAGYFFLIGKFGIKTGDRVQIGGVTGDVIDVGLVKLSLLELSGDGNDRMPTGRVVVFSNAVVFQPNGNFFKQAPGSSFIWNEIRLTLSPDCDYRLVEKRLLDAVSAVFKRYDEQVQRDYQHLAVDLNLLLEPPKPQSRLALTNAGLELIIRYPADAHSAPQIGDEVARKLLDAINREPTLRLAVQGVPSIQPVSGAHALQTPAPASPGAAATEPDAGNGGVRRPK